MAKDIWDKGEIVGKVLGAVLIPVVLGAGGFYYNEQQNQRAAEATEAASKRAATAQMMQIAVGVLTSEPTEETKALREWASEVLKNPGEVIAMNDEATIQLSASKLNKLLGGSGVYAMPYMPGDFGPEVERLPYLVPAPQFEFRELPNEE